MRTIGRTKQKQQRIAGRLLLLQTNTYTPRPGRLSRPRFHRQVRMSEDGGEGGEVIYLDWNATTPIFPEVSECMLPFLTRHFGNPSSSHKLGRTCNEAVVKARQQVAQLVGASSPNEITFTSCGTEADNWSIVASVEHALYDLGFKMPHVVTTNIEHPAITECLKHMSAVGRLRYTEVPVDAQGRVSAKAVIEAVEEETCLITVMHSNNEIGSLQPIGEIGRLLDADHKRFGHIWFHTDAAQSISKVNFDVSRMQRLDLATIVGHKFGAPKGVGAIFVREREGVTLRPFLRGGGQEGGRRAGTENLLHIVGLGQAAEIAKRELDQAQTRYLALTKRLRGNLTKQANVGGKCRINGPEDCSLKLPNTLSISFQGVNASQLIAELSERVCFSAGAACHSKGTSVSGVLTAIDLPLDYALGTLRLSVGRATTMEEIDKASMLIADEINKQLSRVVEK